MVTHTLLTHYYHSHKVTLGESSRISGTCSSLTLTLSSPLHALPRFYQIDRPAKVTSSCPRPL